MVGTPENLQDITTHLSHPASLLKELSIYGGYANAPHRNPALTLTLFNRDLSSLRKLCLIYVRTVLPWGNMTNLTSFALGHTAPGQVSLKYLLDLFKNAPNLRRVDLHSAAPNKHVQKGRLVSLPRLQRVHATGGSFSFLLDHL